MATWTVKFYPFNLLELATVDVNGDADYGFPESRLYDRAISLYWRDTVTEAKTITIDQGASGDLQADFLAIEKHNFDGIALDWQYSSDNFSADTNDAVAGWTQNGNDRIVKTLSSPILSRYWRVAIASIANPRASEVYISKGYEFNCLRESNPFGEHAANVQWNATVGGIERSTKLGPKRRIRNYSFFLSASEFADFETVIDYLSDYSLPFYFKDHSGAYFSARFYEMPVFDFNHATHTRVDIRIIEML